MKCLSISQPFADLITLGEKTIELRNWNTNFRGEFLIHSPLKVKVNDSKRLKIDKKFVTGAIVGKAELYNVKKYESLEDVKMDKKFHLSSKEYSKKTYGFYLKNGIEFRIPIPYKGQLGFFDVNIPKKKNKESKMISDIIDEECRYQWIGHH